MHTEFDNPEDLEVQEVVAGYVVGEADDVALRPGPSADDPAEVERCISPEVRALYDVYSYRHAASLLSNAYPAELAEIERALLAFRITQREIGMPGGNESEMPKKISRVLRPLQWNEARIKASLHVNMEEYNEEILPNGTVRKLRLPTRNKREIENFIDGHKIDYVKGRVAFDMEWNSKDQTFDRDLYAFRTFHECGLISAGVMLTRSASLDTVIQQLPMLSRNGEVERLANGDVKTCRGKYGASTTWMGKLLYRLDAGRHGGCPILAFGIRPSLITDLSAD